MIVTPGNNYRYDILGTTVTASIVDHKPYHFLPFNKPFFGKLNKPAYGSGWVDVAQSESEYHREHYLCGSNLRIGKDLRIKKLFIYCPTCMIVKEYISEF